MKNKGMALKEEDARRCIREKRAFSMKRMGYSIANGELPLLRFLKI
jgi:hypothetical protein